ncbi:MAG: NAD-dependent epimerase/dehydratase family protein [Halobacteriota archaeon]
MPGKALVTGACGFTGSHMLELLTEEGWDVVATDLEGSQRSAYYTEGEGDVPNPVYYEDFFDEVGAEFVPADLTEPDSLDAVFEGHDFDVVFHIASLFDYFAERDVLDAVNVEGGRNIASKAAEYDAGHLVHWSTLGVLGDAGFDEPNYEDADYEPHNRYCESKVEQEKELLKIEREDGLPLTIIRPAPIYGPRHRYGVYHILLLIRKFGFAPVTSLYPRRKQLMFPCVHVHDLVNAALYVHENKDEAAGETYHVTSDCIGQDELVDFLGKSLGVKRKRFPAPFIAYKLYGKLAMYASHRIEKKARAKGTRPKVDASMTHYLTHNMWFSNQKIKDLGFEFTYQDPRKGLWDFISWCKHEGMV